MEKNKTNKEKEEGLVFECNSDTIFSSYYEDSKLTEISMANLATLISDEKNKSEIAKFIYHRLYDRFLKIYFFDKENDIDEKTKELFKREFKHGFSIMTNCCLLVETIAAFLFGIDKTEKKKGVASYIKVFQKAKEYDNDLQIFENQTIYGSVRNGLLHQAEIYDNFKIRRSGKLLEDTTLNAMLFAENLKCLLISYKNELERESWDSELWINCKSKITFIFKNINPKK